jgi:serine/threonine protein kinase
MCLSVVEDSRHHQPRDAEAVIAKVRELPRRTKQGEEGFDAMAIVLVDCRNDGSTVKLVEKRPTPPPGDIFHYEAMIRRVAQLYESRFAAPLSAPTRAKMGEDVVERLFARYDVLDRLPTGGMSEGFKVRSHDDGRVYFLKKVPVSGVPADALLREQAVYTKLERAEATHVLRIYAFERNDDYLALVTDYADGGTLGDYVKKNGPVEPRRAKAIIADVIAGLQELHALDIVHRDLKGDNVLAVGDDWKLGDFGISKNLSRAVTQGRTFQGHGTPGFAPPEQLDGAVAHASADVYALGKLITFVLTGQTDVDQVMLPSWARLARRCTDRAPENRPSVEEVATELRTITA